MSWELALRADAAVGALHWAIKSPLRIVRVYNKTSNKTSNIESVMSA